MESASHSHRTRSDPVLVGSVALLLLGVAGVTFAQDAQVPQDRPATMTAVPLAARTGFLPEPRFIRRSIDFGNRTIGEGGGTLENGFYPQLSNNLTGAGWISVGPGYRRWLAGDRAILDTSAAPFTP